MHGNGKPIQQPNRHQEQVAAVLAFMPEMSYVRRRAARRS
jgi:hypothetical protein